jgi:hypothetical protein
MSNKSCGADVVKKIIVTQPVNINITGATSNLFVCSGTTFVKTISGCTDTVNFNGNFFNNDSSVLFESTISACTGIYTSNLFGCSDISLHNNLIPNIDNSVNLGTTIKRFRDVNTVSGTSTVWTSINVVNTPNLNLGLDSQNNQRIITADNSIIQHDVLFGGVY